MIVRVLVSGWRGYNAGELAYWPADEAQVYIDQGFVEAYVPPEQG